MRTRIVIFIALILAVLLAQNAVEAKKKREYADDKRPTDIEPELYCNSCQAIVREVLKKVHESKKGYEVSAALDKICSSQNFSVYEYPPPDMVKGCQAFIMGWDQVLEDMLTKRTNNQDIEEQICIKRTKACIGVSGTKRRLTPQTVNVNGKEVPLRADGTVRVGEDDL